MAQAIPIVSYFLCLTSVGLLAARYPEEGLLEEKV